MWCRTGFEFCSLVHAEGVEYKMTNEDLSVQISHWNDDFVCVDTLETFGDAQWPRVLLKTCVCVWFERKLAERTLNASFPACDLGEKWEQSSSVWLRANLHPAHKYQIFTVCVCARVCEVHRCGWAPVVSSLWVYLLPSLRLTGTDSV